MINRNKRLSLLREDMKEKGIGVYIIPSADPHQGEYIPDHWQIVRWLTGFTGSAATIVITRTFAGLWTDSRYFLQAQEQLHESGFVLMKLGSTADKTPVEWLADNITRKGIIGFDGRLVSVRNFRVMKEKLASKVVLFDTRCDLISDIWENRPPLPDSIAYNYPVEYAGEERKAKIDNVRRLLRSKSTDWQLLTSPDDIMWLLNLRGGDVKYSPLLLSFALVGHEQVLLFVHDGKIPLKVAAEFDREDIVILPYDETESILSSLPGGTSLILDPACTSVALQASLNREIDVREDISVPCRLKARKNNTEIASARNIMVRDGVALTKFFFWLEQVVSSGKISESAASDKLLELRIQQINFMGESFPPIVAFNEHAAMPHYTPDRDHSSIITTGGILLVDSGGQYLGATTDITRCIATGQATPEMKRDFTLALKGMISLASARFPEGTRGYQLDVLARKALWDSWMNFGHGTGHGVGSFLNVHEGPQSVGPGGSSVVNIALEPGMIISDEPAVYRDGRYGFRTENLLLVVPDRLTEYGNFLGFETLTLCYIDLSLIDHDLLDRKESEWINNYHSIVYEKLSPFLGVDEREWLRKRTEEMKF